MPAWYRLHQSKSTTTSLTSTDRIQCIAQITTPFGPHPHGSAHKTPPNLPPTASLFSKTQPAPMLTSAPWGAAFQVLRGAWLPTLHTVMDPSAQHTANTVSSRQSASNVASAAARHTRQCSSAQDSSMHLGATSTTCVDVSSRHPSVVALALCEPVDSITIQQPLHPGCLISHMPPAPQHTCVHAPCLPALIPCVHTTLKPHCTVPAYLRAE